MRRVEVLKNLDESNDPWASSDGETEKVYETKKLLPFNPEEVDPWSLPSVALEDRSQLPDSVGVYFCLKSRRVLYIGKTENADGFKGRWLGHHRYDQLVKMGGVRIAYLAVPPGSEIRQAEDELIQAFNPELNRQRINAKDPELEAEKKRLRVARANVQAAGLTDEILSMGLKFLETYSEIRTYAIAAQASDMEVHFMSTKTVRTLIDTSRCEIETMVKLHNTLVKLHREWCEKEKSP